MSWTASDVHLVMSCLAITKIKELICLPTCEIRYSPPSACRAPCITVDMMYVDMPMKINTLIFVISQFDLNELLFAKCGTLNDMLQDKYINHKVRQIKATITIHFSMFNVYYKPAA